MHYSVRALRLVKLAAMAGLAGSSLLAQGPPRPPQPRGDTTGQRVIVRQGSSSRSARRAAQRQARRERLDRLRPTTPSAGDLATAYADATSRSLIARARDARSVQDSTLRSYDATVKQRISAGLNFKALGADRLLFRSELAARVQWSRPDRVWVDILGARTAAPVAFPGARVLNGFAEMVPIPWFTGAEGLLWWFNMDGGDGVDDIDDDHPFQYVHPLAEGAEAHYTYEAGDSATIGLPSGRKLALHEVIVKPRTAREELITGSLWFEAGGGQLVRAVFRPSKAFDMKGMLAREGDIEDIPAPVRGTLMNPFEFDIESFTVDYGLHEERWWLPRVQSAKGIMRMGFVRSVATIDQSFRYASVDAFDSLPPVPRGRDRASDDVGDDVSFIVRGLVEGAIPGNQEVMRKSEPRRCQTGDTTFHRQRRGDLRVMIRTPCDTVALVNSPELPPSIFETGEEHFGIAETRALAKELKVEELLATRGGTVTSTPWKVAYGLDRGMLRYNRVEGLSGGLLAEHALEKGYVFTGIGRLGLADLEPNVEARITRPGLEGRSITLGAYRRLDIVDDWGDPFGLGGSLSALVFGRDEGHYMRSAGVDLAGTRASGRVTWRLFAERQDDAPVETHWSLPHATRDARFRPNVAAARADEAGGQLRLRLGHGLDPRGFRAAADIRAEAAAGTFDYTRIAGDLSVSRGLFGRAALSLTGGAGTSGGTVAPQREWRLGGTHTVRGHPPAARAGNSYWLARAELGRIGSTVRPVVFYDMGWAGDRLTWNEGPPVRGAGVGLSVLDGLIRVDLARGLRPTTTWRSHLYVEARF